jgi:hypothetical protein
VATSGIPAGLQSQRERVDPLLCGSLAESGVFDLGHCSGRECAGEAGVEMVGHGEAAIRVGEHLVDGPRVVGEADQERPVALDVA